MCGAEMRGHYFPILYAFVWGVEYLCASSWSDYFDSQIIYPLPGHKNHETSGARTTATKSVVIRRQVEKRELA